MLWLVFQGLFGCTTAHMSIFHPSVYGFNQTGGRNPSDLQIPLGPGWPFDQWWFRGPAARANAPQESFELRAGENATFEIVCLPQFSSYGQQSTVPGSYMDACPSPGPYHADPAARTVNTSLIAGCALGIADKEDIDLVKMEDIAIFSVQADCVSHKMTNFSIPARMPPCTGKKCICAWFWQPLTGQGNYYQTGFDCHVTGSPANATSIAPPQPPTWCDPAYPEANKTCVAGSKQPLYVYNDPTNPTTVPPQRLSNIRPRYDPSWSYKDGPQDDIFLVANKTSVPLPSRRWSDAPLTSDTGWTTSTVGLAQAASATRKADNTSGQNHSGDCAPRPRRRTDRKASADGHVASSIVGQERGQAAAVRENG